MSKTTLDEILTKHNGELGVTWEDPDKELLGIIRTEKLKLLNSLEVKSTHYTPDGLVADGLDPWAVSVATINTVRNKLEAEL